MTLGSHLYGTKCLVYTLRVYHLFWFYQILVCVRNPDLFIFQNLYILWLLVKLPILLSFYFIQTIVPPKKFMLIIWIPKYGEFSKVAPKYKGLAPNTLGLTSINFPWTWDDLTHLLTVSLLSYQNKVWWCHFYENISQQTNRILHLYSYHFS